MTDFAAFCYTVRVNIILFEAHELTKPLARKDERTVHLLKVLRKRIGDSFEAGILEGERGTGRIENIRLDGSVSFSLSLNEEIPPALYPLRLAVGFPRPIQIRRILRDLSSMGIEAVNFMGTELGEKSYRDTKLFSDGGARSAMIEGAAQARDTRIPLLTVYKNLDEWLNERPWDKSKEGEENKPFRARPLLIAADNVRPEGSLANLSALGQPMVMAVGSERGWTDAEREKLENSGFLRLSLGDRALRTETACVVAAAIALEKMGILG